MTRQRVTGIGGVFLRAKDAAALRAWYAEHLGVEVVDSIEDAEHGRFGWAYDCEGNRFELWQPPLGQ